jgi:glutathionylspermidine amidase/synthetase
MAFSNDYDTIDIKKFGTKNYYNGIYTGRKYECVEFVRRWLIVVCNITFKDVNNAIDIFSLNNFYFLMKNDLSTKIAISILKNNYISMRNIEFGDIVIWDRKGFFKLYGHVAVIVGINNDNIYIAEQNTHNKCWNNKYYSRILKIINNHIVDIDYQDTVIIGTIKIEI